MNPLTQHEVVAQQALPQATQQTEGGVIPGAIKRGPGASLLKDDGKNLPTNNQQNSPRKQTIHLLPKIEVLDDVMDISDDSDSSLSPLLYPQNDKEREPLLPKATKISMDPVDTRKPAKRIPSPPYSLLSTGAAPHVPMAVPFGRCISYCSWKEHMDLLREKLKEGETTKETFH